ncbi:hypothetical protein IAQ61_009347 [Plenodomus lingam]|uniref:uncharacterized protein n=1 Tax=Leptosphaeria maculans TaxID=5022 RepID=UPI00331C6438|nr:hypothetical protein IAQ61_009347 [Plenodomus lingam]
MAWHGMAKPRRAGLDALVRHATDSLEAKKLVEMMYSDKSMAQSRPWHWIQTDYDVSGSHP